MHKKNVILLGGSNSVMVNGLQKGLRQENINLTNLALGSTTSIQNLYEIKKEQNKKIIEQADLIITESNVNEVGGHNDSKENLSLKIINRNINWLYNELSKLNTKILIILFPSMRRHINIINNLHKINAKKYNFNLIDLQAYYQTNDLLQFHIDYDIAHPQYQFMLELGKNIIQNIDSFMYGKIKNIKNNLPKFQICYAQNLQVTQGFVDSFKISNSMYNEKIVKLDHNTILKFPKEFYNYKILAIHTWNKHDDKLNFAQCLYNFSNIFLQNKSNHILKATNYLNSVVELQNNFFIDQNTIIKCDVENKNYTEHYHASQHWHKNAIQHNTLNIVSFFLASKEGRYYDEDINFIKLENENIEIANEYNFIHLIPPIKLYKEIIETYCLKIIPKKLAPLQTQINQLQNTLDTLPIKKQQLEISNLEQDLINKKLQAKQLEQQLNVVSNDTMASNGNKITIIYPNSAKSRIQNQLSYKLGQAMIVNSKSLLGYIRMPFVLSYIYDKHKQEQKIYQEKIKKDPSLKLPPLESYPDYKEALKEKECLTYKLGEALIKASNNWYGGGYIKLLLEIRKLKREFRKKKEYFQN